MAITAKSLADGTVPNSLTTIYTVPAATKTYITHLRFGSTSGGTVTVSVYIKRSGSTARLWSSSAIPTGGSARTLCNLPLSTGDIIQIVGDSTACDYTLVGAEET